MSLPEPEPARFGGMETFRLDESGNYYFHWKNHQENLATMVEALKSVSGLTDVTLSCNGFTARSHKLILAMASKFFKDIFEKFRESKHPTIILTEMDPDILQLVIDFLYSGSINVKVERLNDLILAGQHLEIKGLMDLPNLKTSLTSPVAPITATSSSLMMSPPSEPELTPKQTTKNFTLSPDQASLAVDATKAPEPEIKQEPNAGNEVDDDDDDDEGNLIIDVGDDQTEPENLVTRESGIDCHSPESNTTENSNSENSWPEGGYDMLHLLAAAAEMRANLDRASDISTNETSPGGSMSTTMNSSSSSSTPTSGHSMISANYAAAAAASSSSSSAATVAVTRAKAPMKRSLEYPTERHGEADKENRNRTNTPGSGSDSKKMKGNNSALNLAVKTGNLHQNLNLVRPTLNSRTQFYQILPADIANQQRPNHEYGSNRVTSGADNSVQRLTGSTEPFRLSFAHSAMPTIQLAKPTPPTERQHIPIQWITMPSTSASRPTITLQSPNQTHRSRLTSEQSHIPRPVILSSQAADAGRRASLPSVSTTSVTLNLSQSSQLNSSLSSSNASSTWKSRQPTECDFCNRMFSNKFNLKQHILNMHSKGGEVKCELCGKMVKNKWYMRRHNVTHHGAPLKKFKKVKQEEGEDEDSDNEF